MTIFVDADSCPVRVREIVAKAAVSRKVSSVFVANKRLPIKKNSFIQTVQVEKTEGAADAYICASAAAGDLVITRDIPLAAELVRNEVCVINDRGNVFTRDTIGERLSLRNFMKEMRDSGLYESPENGFGPKEVQLFSNTFDRELTRLKAGGGESGGLVTGGEERSALGSPASKTGIGL
jgi:uncharacterized protein YaiI (UPF0178 family)